MLEKDIENLIAQYPEEFFPDKELYLIGQQVKLGSFFADIIFEDNSKTKHVFEIKRGILSRDAVGQILDYYGEIRLKDPQAVIDLVLVANVIPRQRTVFLAEKLGIRFIELPISKIRDVAQRRHYQFRDSDEMVSGNIPEKSYAYSQKLTAAEHRVWIFQANPARYDILNAMSDPDLSEEFWLITKYKNEIHAGDTGLIWISGRDAGIYAEVEILSDPHYLKEKENAQKYWLDDEDRNQERLRVIVRYKTRLKNNPILKEEIKKQPELSDLSILQLARGTNFPVTPAEWNCIQQLIQSRFPAE